MPLDGSRTHRSMVEPDLASYDHIIVAFSGGKDSLACLLHLIERGYRPELWHHDVDGREGSSLMDWPVTRDYCRAVADAFGLPLYFSWKEGGFEGEMLKENRPTAPSWFETPDGLRQGGGDGKLGTRLKFPQVAANLQQRWCSSALKIDVGTMALRNQDRFNHARTLFITGERAQESANRARYAAFEPDRADLRTGRKRRHIDHWRPVHGWSEEGVWAIIERHRVNPHPAYRLGWGRLSCAACIFGSPSQWASLRAIDPDRFFRIADYERQFGLTIHRKESVERRADRGTPYAMNLCDISSALSETFDEPVFLDRWTLPAGAFGENDGPC